MAVYTITFLIKTQKVMLFFCNVNIFLEAIAVVYTRKHRKLNDKTERKRKIYSVASGGKRYKCSVFLCKMVALLNLNLILPSTEENLVNP